MATSAPVYVPLDVYLNTTYRPDREWIKGKVRERNWGEQSHACVQGFFTYFLRLHDAEWDIRVFPEQRVQTSATNYRIPDVCVVRRATPMEPIVQTPPLICIEILSREDRMSDIQERVEDYLTMGVQTVWVVDPQRRRAYETLPSGALQPVHAELTLAGTGICISLADVFAELDEMEAKS
jgi:Uma2 family endonuclease